MDTIQITLAIAAATIAAAVTFSKSNATPVDTASLNVARIAGEHLSEGHRPLAGHALFLSQGVSVESRD